MINVFRNDNIVNIYRMNHPKVISEFLNCIRFGIRNGFSSFHLNFRNIRSAFPNVCVPLAGILDYYEHNNYTFTLDELPDYLEKVKFHSPYNVNNHVNLMKRSVLDLVWKFSSVEDIHLLVDSYVNNVSQSIVCEPGVLEALDWGLNEVMDNVIQHSGKSYGFVMGQIHKSQKHVAFCIYDNGKGIYNSLKDSKYSPRHPIDAITLAIKEGITRDKKIGQGNGLWGLHGMVKNNSGRLYITSGSGSYLMLGDTIQTFKRLPFISKEVGTTSIDFQLDTDKRISVSDALGGFESVNLRIENLEDDKGNINYRLSEKASGTGTRQSGERLRNEILNLHKETGKHIIIDFKNISVVSSSFADELIGKLVTSFGFVGFNQIIRLSNMNSTVQAIVQRSVAQRISQDYIIK